MTRDPSQQPPRNLAPERRESGSGEASANGSGSAVGSGPAEATRPASNLPLRGRQLIQNDPFSQPGYTDSFYDAIGGHETFVKLIDVFYEGVATDPLLRPMYPEEDLGPAKRRFLMFLEQYWGGPGTYSQERGHPRLRMRHMPFRVTPEAKDRWLFHMRSAVDSLGLSPLHEGTLWDYMERAALMMVNSPSPGQGR